MVRTLKADLLVCNVSSKYRLIHKLGEGGMGKVFLAEQVADAENPNNVGRKVAIKFLELDEAGGGVTNKKREEYHKELVRRFINEGRLGFSLAHPHIIAALDYGVDQDERPFLASEFVEGVRPLSALIAQARYQHQTTNPGKKIEHCFVPWSLVVQIGAQIADALAYMHAEQVIHRDMKPDNVLFTLNGNKAHAYIVDLGIAKDLSRSTPDLKETSEGHIVGTWGYMAPEQVFPQVDESQTRWAKGPYNDVYAFGAMLYELVTGESYFQTSEDASPVEIALCITRQPPIPMSNWIQDPDQTLEFLALRCLIKEPWLRPTMEEVRAELAALSLKPSVYPEPRIQVRASGARECEADAPTVSSIPPPVIPKAAALPKEVRVNADGEVEQQPPESVPAFSKPNKTGRRNMLLFALGTLTFGLAYLGYARVSPVVTAKGLVPTSVSVYAADTSPQSSASLPTVTVASATPTEPSTSTKVTHAKRHISPQPTGADKKIYDNGLSSYALKDWRRAEVAMRLLLDKAEYSDLPRAMLIRAECLIQLKRSEEAKPLLKQYLEYPGSAKEDLSAAARTLIVQ